MVGCDACTAAIARALGKKPVVDHIGTRFWCCSHHLDAPLTSQGPYEACLGYQHEHAYLFDAVFQFSELYQGVNKFAFIHTKTPHEKTGMKLKTVDKDLSHLLDRLLELHKSRDDLFMIVMGDHGSRYGPLQ
mmetsp:Transcript_7009/g.3890  ORF Transcript_7009/g.3890 Transcript_7009/m.3890 type:complete len:132 (+) Transcript_7009:75-470(+)